MYSNWTDLVVHSAHNWTDSVQGVLYCNQIVRMALNSVEKLIEMEDGVHGKKEFQKSPLGNMWQCVIEKSF